MKKIAIVTRQMIVGGIESALISMVEDLVKDGYKLTIFVMAKGGEFEKFIPDEVEIKCLYGDKLLLKNQLNNLSVVGYLKL